MYRALIASLTLSIFQSQATPKGYTMVWHQRHEEITHFWMANYKSSYFPSNNAQRCLGALDTELWPWWKSYIQLCPHGQLAYLSVTTNHPTKEQGGKRHLQLRCKSSLYNYSKGGCYLSRHRSHLVPPKYLILSILTTEKQHSSPWPSRSAFLFFVFSFF